MDATSITEKKDCCAATFEMLNAKKILKRIITQHMPSEEKVLNATVRNPYPETHCRGDGKNKTDRWNKKQENDPLDAMPRQSVLNQASNNYNDDQCRPNAEPNASDSENYAGIVAVIHNVPMLSLF